MKKIISLALLCFAVVMLRAQNVPDNIRQNFNKEYPKATNPNWTMNDNYYTVTYQDGDNRKQSITYEGNGMVYNRYSEVPRSDVPSGVSDYYQKNYPNESNYTVYRETDKDGNGSYYFDRSGERYYFNSRGDYQRKTSTPNMGTPSPNTGK